LTDTIYGVFVVGWDWRVNLPILPGLRKARTLTNGVYLVLKNLVLWARSEVFGYASQSFNRNNGTMDEWNGGLMSRKGEGKALVNHR